MTVAGDEIILCTDECNERSTISRATCRGTVTIAEEHPDRGRQILDGTRRSQLPQSSLIAGPARLRPHILADKSRMPA